MSKRCGAGSGCPNEGALATSVGSFCTPYHPRRKRLVVASSRKGNTGGLSVQEGFVDRDGRPVTRHTEYDSLGTIMHGPHFRPGRFT